MLKRRLRKCVAVLVGLVMTSSLPFGESASACPFCGPPQLTMSEMIGQSDHLLLGELVQGTRPTSESAGSVEFRIVAIGRSLDDLMTVDQTITLPFYVSGEAGEQYALMGPGTDYLNWQSPVKVTQDSWKYISHCPAREKDPEGRQKRLAWFLKYLEHPELLVSNDAFGEFAAAPYKVIRTLKDQMPREKLCQWVADPETPVTRIALYGMMLGMCGTKQDAAILENKIMKIESDFRLGLEGVMSGYVVLTGEKGLAKLEDAKIRRTTFTDASGEEKKLPFSETYAMVSMLRFMKKYEPDRVPQERLAGSMYLLLDRPDLSDLIIADLARWKDWSVQGRLMKMYDAEEFQIPSIKRAIVRYMLACEKAGRKDPEQYAQVAASAVTNLQILEEKDARTFRDAKRFFIR